MGTLSHTLKAMGFFSAFGTIEREAFERSQVERKTPFTWDRNNGVVVVYDENGQPWIKSAREIDAGEFLEMLEIAHRLKRGAYVPHSNDGGYFMREVLPKL